ncbi:MAG TPA: VOC family protein [Pseudonocardia sp.]|jgi:catechol 2,3-dioxygenase-like lactoylglutathione lyase family enzyme
MRAKLHRVVIVVADLDAAIDRYTRLFGASFTRTQAAVAAATGVAAAADPDIGIELACPLAGHPSPIAADLAGWLAERGEGIYGMALNCPDDFDEALAGARAEGLSFAMEPLSFSPEQIDHEFGGRYSQYREAIVDRKHLGYALAYNAIVDKK